MNTEQELIRIHNLSHRFANGTTALNAISFHVKPGESVAIIGPNGAGKTTLFLRLAGALPGTVGQCRICGLDPALKADRYRLAAALQMVFQNPDDQLFCASVRDDVAFGPQNLGCTPDETAARVSAALAQVNLATHADRVPHTLSGGEKRRAALATALAMKPQVLLLDEPSMFLDPRGRRELIATVLSLPTTNLIATHDLDLVLECCPRTILQSGGQMIADGPSRELLANETLMETHGLEVPYRLRRW